MELSTIPMANPSPAMGMMSWAGRVASGTWNSQKLVSFVNTCGAVMHQEPELTAEKLARVSTVRLIVELGQRSHSLKEVVRAESSLPS